MRDDQYDTTVEAEASTEKKAWHRPRLERLPVTTGTLSDLGTSEDLVGASQS